MWVDVEDLFEYAEGQSRPSGIQRLVFELGAALAKHAAPDAVAFLRHDPSAQSFRMVPWGSVEALYGAITRPAPVTAAAAIAAPTRRFGPPQAIRELAFRLPPDVRLPLTRFYVQQREALGAIGQAGRAALRRRSKPGGAATDIEHGEPFAARVRPGDVLLAPGAHWYHPNYAGLVEAARRAHGVRFAMLIYDLIPLRRPEWCETGLIRIFSAYINAVLPLADLVLTISRASAADTLRHAADRGIALRSEPVVLPLGTGFRAPADGEGPPIAALPVGPYVLAVSTIEARKNHLLLFHVWRRLLDEMPRDAVPTLVLAGRAGWLVADLLGQLRNCGFLGGKVVVVENASDAELAGLYGGCMFTVFPSFYEGWGLPVSESLAFGCPCIASSATSIPEAGGDLARYFDPANTSEAYAMIRGVIERPDELRAWRADVARRFRPVAWDETASALLRAARAVP